MTIQQLIFKLQDYDPTALVCVLIHNAPGGALLPASDEVYPPEEIVIGPNKYMCVTLAGIDWP